MDPTTADLIKTIGTDALKIIAPAAIAAWVSYRTVKRQFDIERMRLHEKDRVEAHRRLLTFARHLRNEVFPLAQDKEVAFTRLMQEQYFGTLELDYVYFADSVATILEFIEDRFACLTRPELIPEIPEDDLEKFLEEDLYHRAGDLIAHVKQSMRVMELRE